ncbi:DNA polymerase III subunit delta' [Guptibacillus algicola]|uniref:DNA polymerase III subunit delta' n=1 Tax=Guptibacillus algicola TaxID=225844 RepID=UPI001CD395D1|nr:DNA polymerase III subunit delta' [Alkalihalobacillus algicola]MCA0989586.1 DNA polymerase III subunit delta' [Alkalihalobacillus algicola]
MTDWKKLEERQPTVVRMVMNSFKKDRLSHAYLFDGGAGTGKKDIAVHMAKTYFCQQRTGIDPCQTCKDCKRVDSGNHPDLHLVEPDGQSIKIDQIRKLQKEFSYLGVESNKKVYILNYSDRMTTQAANSLLKFLEEPGKMTMAILLTEQKQHILPTIYSRCQVLTFRPLSVSKVEEELVSEGISTQLAKLASQLTNDKGKAIELATDDWFAQARAIVIQLTEELKERPHQVFLTIHDKWLSHFKDKSQQDMGLNLMLFWYKDLMKIQLQDERIVYADHKDKLERYALQFPRKRISEHMMAILDAKRRLSANTNPQFVMEQLVLRLREG